MTALTGSPEEISDIVRELPAGIRVLPVGGGTKPALSMTARGDVEPLDVSTLCGILDYDPAELTLTALAGTPVSDVAQALSAHDQYLPFDPPLARAGATIGGVIAAGVSGAGALRHGSVRDFVIGVRFVDGTGQIVSGGGRVVKNAAGFDFPKLMVGSIGRLGVITQASLKVFPRPQATTTVEFELVDTASAIEAASALARGPVNLDALDVLPDGSLLSRLGGVPELLAARAERLVASVDAPYRVHTGDGERRLWRDAAEFGWLPPGSALVRAGVSISGARELDRAVAALEGVQVRYSVAGTAAWIAAPVDRLDAVDGLLLSLRLPALVLRGTVDRPLLGPPTGGAFGARVAAAIDPRSRFMELPARIEGTL